MVDEVDPRAPRFGQAITAVFALVGVLFQESVVIFLLAVLLVVPVASRWRVDPYGFVWQRGVRRVIGPPTHRESAVPHRFARVVGALCTTVASGLLLGAMVSGVGPLAGVGYGLALVVGALAALGATTGFCLGCRLYRQVGVFRDLGLLTSPKQPQL